MIPTNIFSNININTTSSSSSSTNNNNTIPDSSAPPSTTITTNNNSSPLLFPTTLINTTSSTTSNNSNNNNSLFSFSSIAIPSTKISSTSIHASTPIFSNIINSSSLSSVTASSANRSVPLPSSSTTVNNFSTLYQEIKKNNNNTQYVDELYQQLNHHDNVVGVQPMGLLHQTSMMPYSSSNINGFNNNNNMYFGSSLSTTDKKGAATKIIANNVITSNNNNFSKELLNNTTTIHGISTNPRTHHSMEGRSSERIGYQNNIFSSHAYYHSNNSSPSVFAPINTTLREGELDVGLFEQQGRVSISTTISNSLPCHINDSTSLPAATDSSYSGNSHCDGNKANTSEDVVSKTREKILHVENWAKKESIFYTVKGLTIGSVVLFFLFILVAVLVGIATFALEDMRTNSIRETAKYNCFITDSSIKKKIEVTITALDNIRETVISWDYNVDPDKFDEFAMKTSQYQSFNIIHTFGITRNYTLTEVYPMNVLRSLVGQEIGTEPNHREQLQIAIETNSTTVYGPFLTNNNRYSLIAQQPILDHDLNFWGFSIVVFEFEEIFQQVNLTSLLENYSIRFYDNKQGMTFYQKLLPEHKNYNLTNLDDAKFIYEAIDITIIDSTWELLLIPLDYHDLNVLALEVSIPIIIVVCSVLAMLLSSICFSRYALLFRKDKETLNIIANTAAASKKEMVEFLDATLLKVKSYSLEESNLLDYVNSLEPFVTLVINDGSISIDSVNEPFLNLFGENKLENIKLTELFPMFDINDVLKKNENTSEQDREYILHFPHVEGIKSSPRESVKLSLSLTFNRNSTTEPILCSIMVKPLGKILPNLLEIKNNSKMIANREMFMEMIIKNKNTIYRKSFADFIKKKRHQDDRNIVFIENVENYKVNINLQERKLYMEGMIKSLKLNALFDVTREVLDQVYNKAAKSNGELDLFDDLVCIVIQEFFNVNAFECWQKERKDFSLFQKTK